jgi:hypothetical protein
MDNREAKFILSAYRPHGQDANDPRFSEALEQTRRDPLLKRWFEESVAFDAAIIARLNAVQAPSDLRENILAGVKISRASHWKNRLGKWAIAAALILSATLASLILQKMRPAHLAGWQTQALNVISSLARNESSFDKQSNQPKELVGWLRANHAPAAQRLPDNLDKLSSLGCKTFSWNGVPVSVICFTRRDGGLIHLVTMNATSTAVASAKTAPQFVRQNDWATVTWREGDMIYMLALEGSPDQLHSYVL